VRKEQAVRAGVGVITFAAVSKIEGLNLMTDDTGDVDVKEVNNQCFCFLNRAAAPGCQPPCLGAQRVRRAPWLGKL
jgi:hypothetical protein